MKIWLTDNHHSYLDLTEAAQAVIGLLSMGIDDLDEIAGLLLGKASVRGKRRFAELVSASSHPIIMEAKLSPPSDLAGPISRAIWCQTCGCHIFFVPCRFCSCVQFAEVYTDVQDSDRWASVPTRHLPGSAGKQMVLAARAALGEPLWHPHDGKWQQPAKCDRFDSLATILTRCQDTEVDSWCVPEGEEGPAADVLLT